VAGDSGIIRLGTPGAHSDTYLAGVIHGNGSGLTNLDGADLVAGSVGTAQLAAGAFAAPVSVAGASFNAAPNTSYVGTNADSTTISLPMNANVGDLVQITGAGTGAWAVGYTNLVWTQTPAPSESWYAVASSADGTHLVAAVGDGGIYTSTDAGATWVQTPAPSESWYAVASSADGTHLVAALGGGGIYTSTDAGATWAQTPAPSETWWAVASSADGTHLVAVVEAGYIYTSTDAGRTWAPQSSAPSSSWSAVASSSDGAHLVALAFGTGISTAVPTWETLSTGWQGSSALLQYLGSGQWGPVTLAPSNLRSAVVTNNQTGVTLSGAFSGNGAGLTNVALLAANQTFTGQNTFSANVGIGTTTPQQALDVNGNINASGAITVNGTSGLFMDGKGNSYVGGAGNSSTTGQVNTGVGGLALAANTGGFGDVALGYSAARANTTGGHNTAIGFNALPLNTNGNYNTAVGSSTLVSATNGSQNTVVGFGAGYYLTTGTNNLLLGYYAGYAHQTGDNNIYVGNSGGPAETNVIRVGTAGLQTATYVAGIQGATVAGGAAVYVNGNGQLGTLTSSARFKQDIRNMDDASEVLLSLRPVTFRYKPELDARGIPQFGLVAEEVDQVDPALVVRDDQNQVYTVRYEAVNAMLLNEFLKEHRRVAAQAEQIGKQDLELKRQNAVMQELRQQLDTLAEAVKPAISAAGRSGQ